MKSNAEVIRAFLSGNSDKIVGKYIGCCNHMFMVLNTTIAIRVIGADGIPALLVIDYEYARGFSKITKYANEVLKKCTYNSEHIIIVPIRWGDSWSSIDVAIKELKIRFIDILCNYNVISLRYSCNRTQFINMYNNFKSFLNLIGIKKLNKKISNSIEEVKIIADTEDCITRKALIAALYAKREAARKRKITWKCKKYENLLRRISGLPYLERVRIAFFCDKTRYKRITECLRTIYEYDKYMCYVIPNPYGHDGVITTNIHIMDYDTVSKALKAFIEGRARIGYHVGIYTISEINKSYVKIGCTKFPIQNIKELYSALINGGIK